MGLLAYLRDTTRPGSGCSAASRYNYPKYARFDHTRSTTIADGLILEAPHPQVQQAIADGGVAISLVPEVDIRAAMKELFEAHAVVVEPSSAITLAFVKARGPELEEPICVILTGENIAREDHRRLISAEQGASNVSSDSTGRPDPSRRDQPIRPGTAATLLSSRRFPIMTRGLSRETRPC